MKCKDIMRYMENLAPKNFAEEWDNVGLLVGDPNQEIKRILIALDAIPEVIEEAVEKNIDLIITHHPLPFSPLKMIRKDHPVGERIIRLIQNNIGLYAAHTNLDIAFGGTNEILAKRIGLSKVHVLSKSFSEKLMKIVVFIPKDSADAVRSAMTKAGAGFIGNYSDCTFSSLGMGTFIPREGTDPYIGEKDKLEKVEEVRLETIIPESQQDKVMEAMIKSHPYEEIAYDIYHVAQKGKTYGIGRIGELKEEMTLDTYGELVRKSLNLSHVRVVGDPSRAVKKVALCSGSGMSYYKEAVKQNADVFVTGDIRFHDAQEAEQKNMGLIDAGHYGTERIVVEALKEYIEQCTQEEEMDLMVLTSTVNGEPFRIIATGIK